MNNVDRGMYYSPRSHAVCTIFPTLLLILSHYVHSLRIIFYYRESVTRVLVSWEKAEDFYTRIVLDWSDAIGQKTEIID